MSERNDQGGNAGRRDWLIGGGEMGKLVRSMDWSKTPLGEIGSWPQSLRTTVSLRLSSNFPISLAWGPKIRPDLQRRVLADLRSEAPAIDGAGLQRMLGLSVAGDRRCV